MAFGQIHRNVKTEGQQDKAVKEILYKIQEHTLEKNTPCKDYKKSDYLWDSLQGQWETKLNLDWETMYLNTIYKETVHDLDLTSRELG